MQITEIEIENVGAISRLSLSIPMLEKPKPIILVGGNGTGKTLALSIIADAMIELSKKHFENVTSTVGLSTAFFRVSGSINNRLTSTYNYSFIKLVDPMLGFALYGDRVGEYPDSTAQNLSNKFPEIVGLSGKNIVGSATEDSVVEKIFSQDVFCYFPPSRHEKPFWINNSEYSELSFYGVDRFNKKMKYDIIMETTWPLNRRWVTSVYLDSLSDIEFKNNQYVYRFSEGRRYSLLRKNRDNIELILSAILQKDNLSLYAMLRNSSEARRLSIVQRDLPNMAQIIVPSIDNLSTGQMILFNMFTSILRIAEVDNLEKSNDLLSISGIVVIDEIDAHLHAELQYSVLPNLISLFPKIQFFISTHSPLFILGLENHIGSKNVLIYDMEMGAEISSERFSEFRKSYDYYKTTQKYEIDTKERIRQMHRPTVFFEGESDVIYILKALEVFGRQDLAESIAIDKVGDRINGQDVNGGDTALNRLRDFMYTNHDFLN